MKLKFKIRKARSIKKALRYFDPHKPLWEIREREVFYVQRNGCHFEEIINLLRRSESYQKILLSGPPGCGKTTELARIKEKLSNKFTIIPISARDISFDYQVPPNVLLYNILQSIGEQLKEKNKKLFDERVYPLIKRFQGWQTKKASIDTEHKKFTPGLFERFLKLEESYSGNLETESKLFEKPIPNEIINGINIAAKAFEKRRFFIFPAKPVLILFYNLDKLELNSAREIFITTFLSLVKIECHALFTFPLVLKFDNDYIKMVRNFSHIYFLENFKIYEENGEKNENERKKLAEVILKRSNEKLFYPNILEMIIDLSGGVLFELINIVRECCIIALREKISYIDNEILNEAVSRIRTNYKIVLSEEDKHNLAIIDRTKQMKKDENLTRMLSQGSIVEYGVDENVWYDVNPILKPLLEKFEYEEK